MDYICSDCPRRCGAERSDTKSGGVCASPALPRVARAAPHFGEEPCISGSRGAGTIFFTGCNLRCVYCQNRAISRGGEGRAVSVEALRSMMLRLRDEGVHCIDLVTPTHYLHAVREALEGLELGIPVVWNSSGYESVDALRTLEGLVQVYLPDYKYSDAALAKRYSAAADYPEAASAAIREMFRQTGPYRMDEDGLLVSGVLIRHLILPRSVFADEPVHADRRAGEVPRAAAARRSRRERASDPLYAPLRSHGRLLAGDLLRHGGADPRLRRHGRG